MEIAFGGLKREDIGFRTRKPVEGLVPPVTLLETKKYEDLRPKPQVMFEEQIRDLFNEDLSPERLRDEMITICKLGEQYWQHREDEEKSGYPEINGRLIADIKADYERARLTFEGTGNFPRQVGRVMGEILEMAPRLIEDNFHNLVNRRLMVNYRNGQTSIIRFRKRTLAQNFRESQEAIKQTKLKRVDKFKELVVEQVPEAKTYIEESKE